MKWLLGFLKILIASMQQYLICILRGICSYVCILFAFISLFLKLMVHMLGHVPYITTGFTYFRKPVIIQ